MWKHRKNRHDKSNPAFDYEAWKRKHIAFADAAVPKWVEAVKAQYGGAATRYACVGYCFGAPYVCNELAGDTVTVGAFAHPAFLREEHFRKIKSRFHTLCKDESTQRRTQAQALKLSTQSLSSCRAQK